MYDFDDEDGETNYFDKRKIINEGEKLIENNAELKRGSERYGVCGICKYFEYIKTTFDKEFTNCGMLDWAKPRTEDPIKVCSLFYPKGQLDLNAMFGIATTIDDAKKKDIGFKFINHEEGTKNEQ